MKPDRPQHRDRITLALRNASQRPYSPAIVGRCRTSARRLHWVLQCSALLWVTALLAGCRLDMQIQPKYRGYEASTFFRDGHSEQQPVPGTVARGKLRTDTLMYAGLLNGAEANVFPFPITRQDLERGRQRFNIYCTPCHDFTGSGRGMVVQRGFPPPPSYYEKKLMDAPVGHFFRVMTYGYGTMYSYADRLSTKDRWCVAAYIRALQMTHQPHMNNVPPQEQKILEASGR